jgi:hypothetical protein
MVLGVGFIGRRLRGGQRKQADGQAESSSERADSDEQGRALSHAQAGINDSVHSLHGMDRESFKKPSPPAPPSPTSTLQEVSFLDLGNGDEKASEEAVLSPEDEHSLTRDDPEWPLHEIPAEVDPKDAATPDRCGLRLPSDGI